MWRSDREEGESWWARKLFRTDRKKNGENEEAEAWMRDHGGDGRSPVVGAPIPRIFVVKSLLKSTNSSFILYE